MIQMSSHSCITHTPDTNKHTIVLSFMCQSHTSMYAETPKGGEMGVTTLLYLAHSPGAQEPHSRLMELPIAPWSTHSLSASHRWWGWYPVHPLSHTNTGLSISCKHLTHHEDAFAVAWLQGGAGTR